MPRAPQGAAGCRYRIEKRTAAGSRDFPELPGVTVYGATAEEATIKAKPLALRVIAEEIEHGEMKPTTTRCNSRLRHEPMARDEGAAVACSASEDRLASRTDHGFP
jgi:hypothetical protein